VTETPTKKCVRCQVDKPLLAYAGRQNTCIQCRDAAKVRTLERKDAVAWSPELGEKITDAIAAGLSLETICAGAGMPTARQLTKWRRTVPEFDQAMDAAFAAQADSHISLAHDTLLRLKDGKLPAADARVIVDSALKLAAAVNPRKYGALRAQADVTSGGQPLKAVGTLELAKALLVALPMAQLPAPTRTIDVEAVEAPDGSGR
jgi:terminase small subunit-like protein